MPTQRAGISLIPLVLSSDVGSAQVQNTNVASAAITEYAETYATAVQCFSQTNTLYDIVARGISLAHVSDVLVTAFAQYVRDLGTSTAQFQITRDDVPLYVQSWRAPTNMTAIGAYLDVDVPTGVHTYAYKFTSTFSGRNFTTRTLTLVNFKR